MAKSTSTNRPAKMTVFNTLTYVYKESGIKGLYRGVTPRIGLGIWSVLFPQHFRSRQYPRLTLVALYQANRLHGLFRW